MRFAILSALASAAFLFSRPIIAGVVSRELMQRDCPKQDYDPKGILCSGNSGSYKEPSFPFSTLPFSIFMGANGIRPPQLLVFPKLFFTIINKSLQIALIPASPPASAAALFSAPTKALRPPLSITAPRTNRVTYAEFFFYLRGRVRCRSITSPLYHILEESRLARRSYTASRRARKWWKVHRSSALDVALFGFVCQISHQVSSL